MNTIRNKNRDAEIQAIYEKNDALIAALSDIDRLTKERDGFRNEAIDLLLTIKEEIYIWREAADLLPTSELWRGLAVKRIAELEQLRGAK